jgi:hypothetical protein
MLRQVPVQLTRDHLLPDHVANRRGVGHDVDTVTQGGLIGTAPVPRPGEPGAFGVIEDLLALFLGRELSGARDDRRRSLS